MERQILYIVLIIYSVIFLFELFSDKHKLDDTLNVSVSTNDKKTNKKRTAKAKQSEQDQDANKKEQPAGRLVVVINNRQAEMADANDETCSEKKEEEKEEQTQTDFNFAHDASGGGTVADRDIPLYAM